MRGTITVFRREFGALFAGPLAWSLLFVTLLVNGYMLSLMLTTRASQGYPVDITLSLEIIFGQGLLFWALMLILPPLLAMRLLAEESANGTLEFLRTAPLSDAAVILGKFGAGLAFLGLLQSTIFLYGLGFQVYGATPDWGQIFAIYVGVVLVSGLFLSISLVPSAFSNTPLLAAFLAFIFCLAWLMLPWIGQRLLVQMRVLLADAFGGYDAAERFIVDQLSRVSVFEHFSRSYFRGILDSAEIIFFLAWISLFLFLTTRTLEARRWRG